MNGLFHTHAHPRDRKVTRLTKEEAMELIERIPYIRTLQIVDNAYRLQVFQTALASDDPIEWIKIIKTDYIRRQDTAAKKRPSPEEIRIARQAKEKLHHMLSASLGVEPACMEAFIARHIAETM